MVNAALELYACFFYFTAALLVYWGFKLCIQEITIYSILQVSLLFFKKRGFRQKYADLYSSSITHALG